MIWVIGGTSDAIQIVDLLKRENRKVLVSTTTSYGSELAKQSKVDVIQKRLELSDMLAIIDDYSIRCVIDASHPFAEVVTRNSIEACRIKEIQHIRFERKNIEFGYARYYDSYQQIIQDLDQTEGEILLTIGSSNLHHFSSLDTSRLIARVLPVQESIAKCNDIGLKAHQIIAMKGIMSKETNKALMREYEIQHLVTKDSGEAGGLIEKVEAAEELGVNIQILRRPQIMYSTIFKDINSFKHLKI